MTTKKVTHKTIIKEDISLNIIRLSNLLNLSTDAVEMLRFEHGCWWLENVRYSDDSDKASEMKIQQRFWNWWKQQYNDICRDFIKKNYGRGINQTGLIDGLKKAVESFDKYLLYEL